MSYRLDRIDFSDATHCALCSRNPRPLTTGIVYVVIDEFGFEHAAGPTCAKRKTSNAAEKPPDFTRGSHDQALEADSNGSVESAGALHTRSGSVVSQTEHDRAVEYIRLRAEKLAHIGKVQNDTITGFYKQWVQSSGRLSPPNIQRIIYIIKTIPHMYPRLALEHLQVVYAFDFWLARFLQDQDHTFMRSSLQHLRKHLLLTKKQIETINTIFVENTHRMSGRLPRLKTRAFM